MTARPSPLLKLADNVNSHVETDGFRRGIQIDTEFQEQILLSNSLIREAISEIIPEMLREEANPLYSALVLSEFKKGRPSRRHQLGVNPIDPEGSEVWANLEGLANTIQTKLSPELQATWNTTRIKALLLMNTIINTRELNASPILKINGTDRKISPSTIFSIYKKVKAKGKNPENATLDFCHEIGLFSEIDREAALTTIRITKEKAWDYLESIFSYTNNELSSMNVEKGRTIKRLGINHDLQPKTLFEWVEIMFDESAEPKTRVEAQLLLKFALELYNIRSSPAYRGSTTLKGPMSKCVQQCFEEGKFEAVTYNRINFDEEGNIQNVEIGIFEEDARLLKIDDPEERFKKYSKKAIFIDFDDKGAEAILTKFLTKEPDQDSKDVRDHLRCMVVTPDLTLKDYENDPDAKAYAYKILTDMGKSAGLSYRSWETISVTNPLAVGEFTIEENLDASQVLFRNLKLLGNVPNQHDKTELGTTLEIQFNTIDVHEIVQGKNSPFDRKNYEGLRTISLVENCLPKSHYKQAHKQLVKKKTKIKDRRSIAMNAAAGYVANRNQIV